MSTCQLDGCELPVHAHGYCSMHAARLRRTGDPLATRFRTTDTWESFAARTRVLDSGCRIVLNVYTGDPKTPKQSTGYGEINVDGICRPAHRVAYELAVGPIPNGMHLDHLCRNRACCEPTHLEPVTPQENCRRAAAIRTACPQEHPLSGHNLYVNPRGHRECRECRRESSRRARRAA